MTDKGTDFAAWLQVQFELIPRYVRAADIARMTKLSPGYLSALRKGIKGKPSIDTAAAIAGAFAEIRHLTIESADQLKAEAFEAAGAKAKPVAVDAEIRVRRTADHPIVEAKLVPPSNLHGFDLMVWRELNRRCACGHRL